LLQLVSGTFLAKWCGLRFGIEFLENQSGALAKRIQAFSIRRLASEEAFFKRAYFTASSSGKKQIISPRFTISTNKVEIFPCFR